MSFVGAVYGAENPYDVAAKHSSVPPGRQTAVFGSCFRPAECDEFVVVPCVVDPVGDCVHDQLASNDAARLHHKHRTDREGFG